MNRLLAAGAVSLATAVLLGGCLGGSASRESFVPAGAVSLPGSVDAWRPPLVGLGDPATSGLDDWTPPFDNAPTAFDVDGDGTDELLAQGADGSVYVFSVATGRVLAVLPTTLPTSWHVEKVLNTVAAGVLRPGEPASIVATNPAAHVAVWRFEPEQSDADAFVFTKTADPRVSACDASPSMDAGAALGDLDGDGTLEIVVQTEEIGFYALRADGTTLWAQCWGGGNGAPVVADLDGDGRLEVVVASDAGLLAVLDGATGAPLWTFDARAHGITPASVPTAPTVAELDGAWPREVLFTARHAPSDDPATFGDAHMAIVAVRQDPTTYQAELVWMRQPDWANPMSNTRLLVADVDGDGRSDVFGMDWNTIGHHPGDWEVLGPAHVFRLDAEGRDVWVREVDAWWSNHDIVLGDLSGDGSVSVLANGPAGPYDGIWRLSADDGTAQDFLPLSGWRVARGPQLLDLSHDGGLQLVLAVESMEADRPRGAIVVFDLGGDAGGSAEPAALAASTDPDG